MKLNKVTITGADETIKPSDLMNISKEYPFVEWGILFSKSSQGLKSRYPALKWVGEVVYNSGDLNLSAHICGQYVRDILSGEKNIPSEIYNEFKRIQLNFKSFDHNINEEKFIELLKEYSNNGDKEIIFQLRKNENDNLFWSLEKLFNTGNSLKIAGLLDKSGGTGLSLTEYPKFDSIYGTYFGYAGGINPDNIENVIQSIEKIESNNYFWIDMETGVRSKIISAGNEPGVLSEVEHDIFDLNKVIACLEIAKKYIHG